MHFASTGRWTVTCARPRRERKCGTGTRAVPRKWPLSNLKLGSAMNHLTLRGVASRLARMHPGNQEARRHQR